MYSDLLISNQMFVGTVAYKSTCCFVMIEVISVQFGTNIFRKGFSVV